MRNAPSLALVAMLLVLSTACGVENSRDSGNVAAPSPSASPSASDGVPPEFRAACGKPGSTVVTEQLKVVIKGRECHLTGVTIVDQGRSIEVPKPGLGSSNSSGVTVEDGS